MSGAVIASHVIRASVPHTPIYLFCFPEKNKQLSTTDSLWNVPLGIRTQPYVPQFRIHALGPPRIGGAPKAALETAREPEGGARVPAGGE